MKLGQPTQTVVFGWLPDEPMVSRTQGTVFENVLVRMPTAQVGACEHCETICDECEPSWRYDWDLRKVTVVLN